jgi:hypothetical protein
MQDVFVAVRRSILDRPPLPIQAEVFSHLVYMVEHRFSAGVEAVQLRFGNEAALEAAEKL